MKGDKYCNNCGCYIPIGEVSCISCNAKNFEKSIDGRSKIVYNSTIETKAPIKRVCDIRYCPSCEYYFHSNKHPNEIYCKISNRYNLAFIRVHDEKCVKCPDYTTTDKEILAYIKANNF